MRTLTILLIFLNLSLTLLSQNPNVKIVCRILDYDGFSQLQYTIEEGNYHRNLQTIQPDKNGRFVIETAIDKPMFFWFHYRNKGEEHIYHECRLILQPYTNYSIVSEGFNYENFKTPHSPDIYSCDNRITDNQHFLSMDFGQINYNLIDGGSSGSIYHDDWNLYQPDSLLNVLNRRIDQRVSIFTNLLRKGEITKDFYEIAKANVEYVNAYQLAQTIQDIWTVKNRYGINDSCIANRLACIHDSIFQLYPVDDSSLVNVYQPRRYIDAYLYNFEAKKLGSHTAPQKGSWYSYIDEIRPILPKKVYENYKLENVMSKVGSLELESSSGAKKFLLENPSLKNTQWGDYLENELIPRSEMFDSLSLRELPNDIVFVDETAPVESLHQLANYLGNKPFLIDFWGSWCGICREQFKYNQPIKNFLSENGIAMVYAAYEYKPDRVKWKRLITAYELTGYHFILSNDFKNNLKESGFPINGFPSYMIVDGEGNVIEPNAYTPAEGEKLIHQLKEELKLSN